MPRYDYKCEANGHVFEVTQSFTDDPVAFCPDDGSAAQRQLSVPHVIYKGSGFYTTDYKNGSSSGSSRSAESKKSESDSKDTGSSKQSSKSSGSGDSTTKAKSGSDNSKS